VTPLDTLNTSPSLEDTTSRINSLLSQAETKEKVDEQPEPPQNTEDKQAQPETDERIEAAESEEKEVETEEELPPKAWKVTVAGQEVEVTEDELLKGYSRHEDYTRKTMQLSQKQKEWEERDVAAVRSERQEYADSLQQLHTILTSIAPPKPDFEKLKLTLPPDQYAAEIETWHKNQERIAEVEKTQATLRARQDEDAQRGFAEYVRAEQEKLQDALPDFREPEKARTLKKNLSDFALSRGFTEDDLSKVTDHRLVLLLHDAMEGKKAKEKAPEIKNKITRVLESSAPGGKNSAPKNDELKQAREKARRNGDKVDDVADVLTALARKAERQAR
jgi:hypothetical protein